MADYNDVVEQIKKRLDIVDVVSQEVALKKSGGNYWGLCPFHKEKSPSFSVNPTKGIFKCFGCGEGGDALTFLMKINNMEFHEVIADLAEKYGIEMPNNFGNKEKKSNRDEMMSACEKAAIFYAQNLTESKGAKIAKQYLEKRGITDSIIKTYTLGLAPKEPNLLYLKLKKDFSTEILEQAGLILKTQNGEYIDRFRNRITIPIQNEHGQYVAFGARAIEEGQNPKYLNSADSPIYNKSRLLYGLFQAKDSIKEKDSIIIMEGYFDVISAQAHGITNAVASCGTSMTHDHIKLIARYCKSKKIYLSFDTDSAGVAATERGAKIIKETFQGLGSIKQFDESYISCENDNKYSCEIRVIAPPEGKDPDEFIRTVGENEFKAIIEHAPLLLDFQLNTILKHKNEADTPLKKNNLVKEIIPLLKEIKNEIIRSEYIKMVSSTLNLDERALTSEVNKFRLDEPNQQEVIVKRNVTKSSCIEDLAQKNLLSFYLVSDSPYKFYQIKELIGEVEFSNETLIIVKTTIDKITCTVNNVRELIEQLYTEFIQDSTSQAIVTELIGISEAFHHLDPKDFKEAIEENKQFIDRYRRQKERQKMQNLYKDVNDDDTEALKLQMQLRDNIKNRLRTGDN